MTQNLGTIQYTVSADTAALIEASRKANAEIAKMGDGFDKTKVKADEMTKSLGLLKKVLGGYLSLSFSKTLIDWADSYQVMSDRVMLAVNSTEEYNAVQERLLKMSNQLYRPLAESQELFIGTSDNLRDLGYTLNQTLDIVDSLSGSFVRNATSAQKADSALKSYDRVLNTGKVTAMDWQTLMSAIPNVAKDIGDAIGKSAEEVRNLGVQGQVTANMLNEGLLKSMKANVKAASEMKTTVADAYISMKDNVSVYISEQNEALGITELLAAAIDGLGKNIDVIAKGAMVLGAAALGNYTIKVGANTLALAKNSLANIKNQLEARKSAIAAFNNAKANLEVTKAAALAAQRNYELSRSHGAAKAAADQHALSVARYAAAEKAAKAATFGLTSMLGGPAGIIGLLAAGATAFALFSDSAEKSRKTLDELGLTLDDVVEKFKKMDRARQEAAMSKYLDDEKQAAKELKQAYTDLKKELEKMYMIHGGFDTKTEDLEAFKKALSETEESGGDFLKLINELARKWEIGDNLLKELLDNNKALVDLKDSYEEAMQVVGKTSEINQAARSLEGLELVAGRLPQALRNVATATTELTAAQRALNKEASDSITSLTANIQKQIDTLEDGGNSVKAVDRELARLVETGADINYDEIFDAYKAAYLHEAIKKNNEELKKTGTIADRGAEAIADLQKQLYLATLSGKELVVEQARLGASDYATQEQINRITELAGALYEVQEIMRRKSAFGDTAIDADNYILGDTSPLSGGMFDDQYARYEAEAVAEQERYAAQLERLKEAKELQIETSKDYYALEEEAAKTHADRMAQIEQAKSQVLTQSASSMFGSIADILEKSEGEQSKAYKGMFIAAKAFSLSSTLLALPTAISEAMKLPWPANLVAAGGAAATVTAQIASVKSVNYGGGRQYGGPVAANKMYRINETGEPEIFNAGGGRQYFLPNQRGEVVSAKDSQKVGGDDVKVTVHLHEDARRAGQVEQQTLGPEQIINIFVRDIGTGGRSSQILERSYGLRRHGYK